MASHKHGKLPKISVNSSLLAIVAKGLAGLLWNTWGVTIMLSERVMLSVITEIYVIRLNKFLERKERDNKRVKQLEKKN